MFPKHQNGSTAIEYSLIVAVLSLAIIVVGFQAIGIYDDWQTNTVDVSKASGMQ